MEILSSGFQMDSAPANALEERQLAQARLAADGDLQDEEAVDAFQKLLATQLVKEMRRTLPDGLFGGGAGADIYESWFDQHVAQALSDTDALGLAGMLKTSLGAKQEASDGGPQPQTPAVAVSPAEASERYQANDAYLASDPYLEGAMTR